MPLDTRHLRYFLAIADQGSITAAAQVLGVAQPALSLHLKRMEEDLGRPLMLRQRTGVVPTEAGQVLIDRARRILDELARVEDDVRTFDRDPEGLVRIGLPGTISDLVALPLIQATRARHPRITLNIAEAMSGFVANWLMEDRVDLAILYHDMPGPAFETQGLLEEELVVLWGGGDPRPAEVPLLALKGVPMVLTSRGHGLRDLIETTMQAQGLAPDVAIEIDSYRSIKTLVAQGYGPSILPAHAVEAEAQAGQIQTSRIAQPGLWRRANMIQANFRPKTRAQQAVAALLVETVTDLVAQGQWSTARLFALPSPR